MNKRPLALISVADRTGLVPFAKGLLELGFELLTTSGSGAALGEAGIASTPVEAYTQSPEILGGRVKTLHPSIHAGLLAKLSDPQHVSQLEESGLRPITVCAVNLYPFSSTLRAGGDLSLARMTELIDIGGPTMIRAAAKNHKFVLPVIDPADYPRVVEFLSTERSSDQSAKREDGSRFRLELAAKVFEAIAHYDLDIARYTAQVAVGSSVVDFPVSAGLGVAPLEGFVGRRVQTLRYGENPHQQAAFYRDTDTLDARSSGGLWSQLGGKELSYNNFLDLDASLRVCAAVSRPGRSACAIIKHANPCGVAYAETGVDAIRRAKRCDPRSHFGGIIVVDFEVDEAAAAEVRGDFAELVVAPSFSEKALQILKTSASLRLIQADLKALAKFELRGCLDGVLVQSVDAVSAIPSTALVGSLPKDLSDLELAWAVCSQTKSNAIVIAKDGIILGTGAGQMSRVDSVELAISKAKLHGHDLTNSVAASDAFFPFPDGLETLIAAGVRTVIAPIGAKRDAEVLDVARRNGVTFLGATQRHFRH
jgi:phosphoribosylaminoimidazolecarboxamide formyltransferase/IMP cyclohydrolase